MPDREIEKERKSGVGLDFTARPGIVRLLAEGERLSFGHHANPVFATEISNIDPLPHQRIAVYEHMLSVSPLRFLLADDAGAGKTIMCGLYIREMFLRRLLKRVLIVSPAGLLGNWQRELLMLFNMPFRIVSGSDARQGNPFIGEKSDHVIVSVDTLASARTFARLQATEVAPYELVVFDEAHKLAADRTPDMRIRRTERYKLAEALAGVQRREAEWKLAWSTHHLLLLTATPHMGKDYPYYALWRLLEPDAFTTPETLNECSVETRRKHFLRRTKEEMVYLDGKPLYPTRVSDTLGYDLSQGKISEQALYDETTEYLRLVYNRAKMLNRQAARLAMSVFQRRLASSTYALLRSFERRIEKLDKIITAVREGKWTIEQLITMQQRMRDEEDVFDAKTAEDEASEKGVEENEIAEEKLLQGVVAASLEDLVIERQQVVCLLELAKKVYESGQESKFEKLGEILTDVRFNGEKMIVFTEHRDTLEFLVKRLKGMGYTDQIAQIHGGMHYTEREGEVERFRKPMCEGGAQFLICTDAAGEGINLQFCWIMINYDVPWNPARLEQRMGRIHRYGQKHDPVIIINLVSPSTREGKVLKVLLEKLERIRKQMGSDKVFDCIGRIFSEVSIKRYMERVITGNVDTIADDLDGHLTEEQVTALEAREKALYGSGGDVAKELSRLRESLEQEVYLCLLPGYVRQYVQQAAPLVGIEIEGDVGEIFSFRAMKPGVLDSVLEAAEIYSERAWNRLTVTRPVNDRDVIWLRPGEPVFERFRSLVSMKLGEEGERGAIFVDPTMDRPYLFHMALLMVVRGADPEIAGLSEEEVFECRLVGIRQFEGSEVAVVPVEHLLLLKGGCGLPSSAQRLALVANQEKEIARAFLMERVAREMAIEHKNRMLEALPDREASIQRGFDYQEAELAAARVKHSEKARTGNQKAVKALAEVKHLQRSLQERRQNALAALRREPDLIGPGAVTFIAHALVVPSSEPQEIRAHDINVEIAAMRIAQAFEESTGAKVMDVHTPDLAREAGLQDNPGFDNAAAQSRLFLPRGDCNQYSLLPSDAASQMNAVDGILNRKNSAR